MSPNISDTDKLSLLEIIQGCSGNFSFQGLCPPTKGARQGKLCLVFNSKDGEHVLPDLVKRNEFPQQK